MKLNAQRFSLESFKEQQSWIAPFLSSLNQFIGEVISGFNNNLTVEDNLNAEIKEIKFINKTNNFPLKFRTKFTQNPQGLFVIYCLDNTTSTMNFASAPWVNWNYNNGEIQINSVQGLTTGNAYTLRLYVVYK